MTATAASFPRDIVAQSEAEPLDDAASPRVSQSLPRALTDTQKAFFSRFGYVALDRITSDADVGMIRREVEELFARQAGFEEGMFFDFAGAEAAGKFTVPQLCGPHRFAPALLQTQFYRNALSIARQLLGPDVRLTQDHVIMKPAGSGGATPWHQDEAFGDPKLDYHEISFWLALQDVDDTNGCLSFVPGSHRGDILPHAQAGGDKRVHALDCSGAFDHALAVSCPLPAGGCTLHTTKTIHGAGPNHSDAPRWAYVIVFGLPPTPHEGKRGYPWLTGRETARMQRRRSWMIRGGAVVQAWRKFAARFGRD
jgi:ectoine hydroxylase-related dioxygenase (phytanoyl-CoA dioxygenase family)